MNRRDSLKFLGGAAAFVGMAGMAVGSRALAEPKPFTLPPLGYANDALEPHIDTKTMQIHHDNHHAAYVNNLNSLVDKWPDLATKPIDEILSNLATAPEAVRTPVRNNLGGHWNHTFFWELMTPEGLGRFGSGWAWLVIDKDKKLAVFSTANQDSPQMEGAKAVIGIDVWEHAYYLKYQYKRADYIDTWWNVVNWDKAAANFKKAAA